MSVSLETLALAKRAIAKAIADISGAGGITYSIVDVLPSSGLAGVIYLLPREDEDNRDLYEEYIWVNGSFERIPWKTVDLSAYANVQADWAAVDGDAKILNKPQINGIELRSGNNTFESLGIGIATEQSIISLFD